MLPQWILRDHAGVMLQSRGEWVNAYQRVTHYFRTLDVWQPPPHLLALAVLERALRRADGDHGLTPLRLAMHEVHALLGGQAPQPAELSDVSLDGQESDWRGSVCWRIGSWLWGGGNQDAPCDIRSMARWRPVPPAAPGPMVPQPLEASPSTRAMRALAMAIRHLLGAGWRRRHA